MGGPGMHPGGTDRPERPDTMGPPEAGQQPPEDFTRDQEEIPPEGTRPQEGGNPPEMPDGSNPGKPNAGGNMGGWELTTDFVIRDGANMFSGITYREESETSKEDLSL